jgi:uncharacterized protein (UPF0335 family)
MPPPQMCLNQHDYQQVTSNKQSQDLNKARVYSLEEQVSSCINAEVKQPEKNYVAQVERLECSSQALEKDNKGLRDELKTAHINLHKIKESNNVLHETITKLKQLVRVPKGCQHGSI